MPEEDIKTILRALGKLEGRFDGVEHTLEGVQTALAEIARKNAERDLEVGDHDGRIARLESWKASVKEASVERRRSWRDQVALWVSLGTLVVSALWYLHIVGVL